ncbi:uncharacterized protein LOC115209599 [Octopus sinensis]|uniref:Uncharacterized protein LOC115209599 n=1 Tax=Octopus sinensis TaxID=2607531 RepID=A0A6P7S6I2_9MOLL|nr:uncharacterized protein LOC115209599 [Octopus sinensis]
MKEPARQQRLRLRLQTYDYDIRYKPGKDLILADALSRLSSHDKQEMEGLSIKVHHIINVTTTKLAEIKEDTRKDEELQLFTQMVIEGWPEKRHQVQSLIREYWAIHDDISVENGILMAGSRIIIPKSMTKEILDKIHKGHLGMEKLKDLRAKTITTVARKLLAEQVIPEQIICDNGTQFTSQEFKKLADEYGFNITTSSPHYTKGHGFIERQVQTVKRTLVKCRETKEDPHLALLSLRATPLRADMKSPAELLNGMKYKTTLPSKIQPPIDQEETRTKLAATQEHSQKYYNRHAQYLPEILRGQHVHTQDPITKIWIPAQVVRKAETPRSYIIETESGRQLRRNRAHIRPTRKLLRTTYTTPAASVTTPTELSPQRAPTTHQQATCTTPTASVTTPTESSSQWTPTTHQQPNNTPQTPA